MIPHFLPVTLFDKKTGLWLAIEWYQNNNMKSNQDRGHLLVSGYKHENVWAQIGDEIIWESNN